MQLDISKRLILTLWSSKLKQLSDMSEDDLSYLEVPICNNKDEEMFVQDTLIQHGAIPLNKLEVHKTYIGFSRNTTEAMWNGEKFVYPRTKFGYTYDCDINHFQNDDGYDVFVPVRIKE